MKNIYIGISPVQNRTDSGTRNFSTPQSNMEVSFQQNSSKSPQMYKVWDKSVEFLQISGLFPIF